MPYLEQFTDEQRVLLVSLPYRTGLWVSKSDDGGGETSEEAEMKTLEGLIVGYGEDFLKSEFVEEIMKQALASKDKWREWEMDLDTVPRQCQEAVALLQGCLDQKDVLSFRQALMEIAMAIAMAYREFDEGDQPLTAKISLYSLYYWKCFMAKVKGEQQPSLDAVLNISRNELEILKKLSEALDVDLEGRPADNSAAA